MSWQQFTPTKKGFFIGMIIGAILSLIFVPIAMGCFDSLGHAPKKYEICRTPYALIFTVPSVILYFIGAIIFFPIDWAIYKIADPFFLDKFGFMMVGIQTGITYAIVFGLIGMLIGYIIKKRKVNKGN